MKLTRSVRKNIYRWHRISSLIIALPVMLWALSGLMHPIMTNIRPAVATQSIQPAVIDTSKMKVSLQQALQQNRVPGFCSFRLVGIGGHCFYQVKMAGDAVLRYFSTENGKELAGGDGLYARYLAQRFLGNSPFPPAEPVPGPAVALRSLAAKGGEGDCCAMASKTVLSGMGGSQVAQVGFLTAFDEEYKYINRLLPVYRVDFERKDGIRLYVETGSDRFAFAMDDRRQAFDRFFSVFHTWSWMDGLGRAKYVVMVAITGLGFLTSLMGLYIAFTTRSKKSAHPVVKKRRRHRTTSLLASVFFLLFTFSGGYHALVKLQPEKAGPAGVSHFFKTAEVHPDFSRLQAAVGNKPITNLSVIRLNGGIYYQVCLKQPGNGAVAKDLMKSMQAAPPLVVYVSASDYSVLEGGERQYAVFLAKSLSGMKTAPLANVTQVTRFGDEYPFVNKRLPVWKIAYAAPGHPRCFVETATGMLAAQVDDAAMREGYSFALFHKHHFMDWAGKEARDGSTMVAAVLVLLACIIGLVLWAAAGRG